MLFETRSHKNVPEFMIYYTIHILYLQTHTGVKLSDRKDRNDSVQTKFYTYFSQFNAFAVQTY